MLLPADIWGDFFAGIRTANANFFGGLVEFGMVIAVFVFLIGVIMYFAHYSKKGLGLIVDSIVGFIVLTCAYMAITGTTGPPDISIFFRLPGA